MSKGIVITPDGEISVKEINDWEGIKAELNDAYLELISLGGFNAYVDEEGKSKGLEPNPVASVVVQTLLRSLGRTLTPGDFISGNIVFLGQKAADNPEDGWVEGDLPHEIIDRILLIADKKFLD